MAKCLLYKDSNETVPCLWEFSIHADDLDEKICSKYQKCKGCPIEETVKKLASLLEGFGIPLEAVFNFVVRDKEISE